MASGHAETTKTSYLLMRPPGEGRVRDIVIKAKDREERKKTFNLMGDVGGPVALYNLFMKKIGIKI